jgi:hypothetical protein
MTQAHYRTRKQEEAMRMTTLAVLVFGLVIVQTDRGRAQASGTQSELADDALSGALWRIAVATHTRIGFESVDFVRLGLLKNVLPFPVSSRDEALNAAVDANPRYEWRAIGDVVVVRPKSAWNDPGNPFNRPVRNLHVENATESGVLLGLRDFIYTNRFAVLPRQSTPVAFDVQSGTVIDVLDRLMESADAVLWNAAYRPNAQPGQRLASWDLQLALRDAKGMMRSVSGSCPALPCVPKR